MGKLENVSVLLPTLNETFSFVETVRIIASECDPADIGEIIAIVCDRTTPESLASIGEAKALAEEKGIPLRVLYQTLPYAGGAVRDGITAAASSHTLMMAPDLETDPHTVKDFVRMGKQYPEDMITASRWRSGGSFRGYNPVKYVLNWLFQKIFALFYGVRLTDMTFCFRLAPTAFLQSVAWEELKHPFFLETCLKPIRLGMTVHEIPSQWAARQEGESQNSLLQTFKYLRIAFKVRFEPREKLLRQP